MISTEEILAAALRERTILDHLGEALTSDLVLPNSLHRRIAEFAYEFSAERRALPGPMDWELWLSGMTERDRPGLSETLQRVLSREVSGFDPGFFGDRVLQDLRQAATQTARARLNAMTDPTPEAFQEMAARIEKIAGADLSRMADLSDWELWVKTSPQDDLMPSGFPELDDAIGGWGKELIIVFADSGVGKSMLLQNFGVKQAVQGKRGIHISLELGLRPMIHRYYRQIVEKDRGEFRSDQEDTNRRLRHFFQFAKGSIYLVELPAYETTTQDVRQVIERVSRAHGDLDFVILDYMDLMALPAHMKSRNSYEDLNRITHLIRSYCAEFDLPVLTASQAVRRPEKAGSLTVRDMGDSYGKVRGADVLLSLVQTQEEEEVHQGRIGVLKVREYDGRGREVPVYINRDLALIAGLNHPNTLRIMRKLGHLTDRPVPGPGPQPGGVFGVQG